MSSQTIAVIGAGISGLTCAYELQKAGFKVTVFEKEDYVGGRMASREKEGLIFDIGADHLCDLYDHMKEYCKEFDIPWQKMAFLKYAIFKDGEVMAPTAAIGKVAKLKLALQYMKKRRVFDFFDLESAVKYDTDNAYHHMKKKIGKQATDYLVDGFTSTYQFHGADEISVGALFGIMDSIKNDKSKWYLHRTKGGMSALPEEFAKRLKVHTGEAISSVQGTTVTSSQGKQKFDAVVLATTPDITTKILKDQTKAQKELLTKTTFSSTISVAFRVDKVKLPNTSIVWVPEVQSKAVSGYVNESMKGEQLIKDGKSLIDVWLHEDFTKTIIKKSDEEIFRIIKEEFLKVCPWVEEADLEGFDLHKWEFAMPKFSQGHLTRVASFLKGGQGENNVYLCGDFMNSPWTEGALRCGKRTAARISKELQ